MYLWKWVRKKISHLIIIIICDVIVNQGLVCLGLYGVSTNLVMYLIRELRQGASSAATNTSNWQGAVYFFSVIGGFVGDAYLGRYWASFLFQLLGISVSTLTYDSTHTFHYGPIVSYLTSKDENKIFHSTLFVLKLNILNWLHFISTIVHVILLTRN